MGPFNATPELADWPALGLAGASAPVVLRVGTIADGLIAAVCFSVLIASLVFRVRRQAAKPSWAAALLAALCLLFGATNLADALASQIPVSRFEVLLKAITALLALAAAPILWHLVRRERPLPGSERPARPEIPHGGTVEESFRLLVTAVSNYAILLLDPAGHVTSWNAGAERIKGYKDGEILGRHFSCFYTDEDMARGKPGRGLDIAAAEGRFEDEGWRVRKDGSRFWASVVITAIRDKGGQLLGYGKMTRDLTERRRAEQALNEMNESLEARVVERTESLKTLSERLATEIDERKAAESTRREAAELLQAMFDAAPLPIMILGPEAEVLMWNKAGETTFGYGERDLVLGGSGLLIPADRWKDARRVRQTASSMRATAECPVAHRDGRILDIRLATVPLFSGDGTVRAVVAIMEDLTTAKRIEAQLRQSQKMEAIGTLTGGMAHDFNNILGIIIGNLDLLRESRADDAEVMLLASEALDAATRGADLTRSLLAYARQQPLRPQHIDLDVVITGLVKLLARLLGSHIEISLNLAEEICGVVADIAQFEASLTNLATNARDAMPRGGKLTIATSHRRIDAEYASLHSEVSPGEFAMVEVTDTGSGMSREVIDRIFEPFFTTKNEGGSGLGLSMVFGFMKQSGGHITVYSELGVGTTFRLYFPCALRVEEPEMDLRPDGPLAGNHEVILAVEDNEALRRLVVRQLVDLGYRVIEASNALGALAVLDSEKVDLLFSDVVMPGGIDGFALADTVVNRWPHLKVILTSGFPQSRFTGDSLPRSIRLLGKPYRKGNLAQLVRAALDEREKPQRGRGAQ